MSTTVRLQPYARLLRRDPATVQVGLVGAGVVLTGLGDADVAVLERLAAGADLDELTRRAARTGARLETMLDALRARHLVVGPRDDTAAADEDPGHPERVLLHEREARARAACYARDDDARDLVAARARRHVVVHGVGRLAEDVAAALREAGIGRLTCGDGAALHDLGWREGEADPPDAVVLVGAGAVTFEAAEPWRRRRVPHVPVVLDGPRLVVGPWVGGHGPCLTCLDLHRADRDPAWPTLLRQLAGAHDERVDGDACLRPAAAALVTALVTAAVDGCAEMDEGVSTEVALPWLEPVRRRWTPHPRCRCPAARGTMEG